MDYRSYAYSNGQRTGKNIFLLRSRKDGIIRNGMAYVNYASKVGKKVVIIVETGQQTPGKNISSFFLMVSDYTTFYNKTPEYMEQELALVHNNFSAHPGFDSLCIHQRSSWEAMGADDATNPFHR
jgi:uncharacterized protein (DUF1919 family)